MKSICDIVLDNDFIWDLEGLVDINLLEYGSPYILGTLVEAVKGLDKYTRASFFGENLEYTTSPEIYDKLGLLSFSFDESKSSNNLFINYSLTGNIKILDSVVAYDYMNEGFFPCIQMK